MQTKLFRPSLRPSLITRSPLIERLNTGLDYARLTLISAPAGFGKTTLVTAWLETLNAEQANIGWLSLDQNDNDPIRFLSYLIAALQTAVPSIGETAVRFLQSPQPPAAETILTLLINDISQVGQPIVLVLDDYHVIAAASVHQILAFLLDHLPPLFHLLITTRSDPQLPLSRLRVGGQMVELRANDLRFTLEEVRLYFPQVMGLELSGEETTALEERTEGWIAGLHLVALALQRSADVPKFIATLTGSHRYIMDYLIDEVLQQRPQGTEQFLLQTANLDRVCASLCNAITGRTDSQDILERLEQSNLFLVSLDEVRGWYRYHHLFADVLRYRFQRSQPEALPQLFQTASTWFEDNGLIEEAVHYALQGKNTAQAARLIEQAGPSIVFQGRVHTLQSWLAAFPHEAMAIYPVLSLYQAAGLIFTGQLETAERHLQDAEQNVSTTLPPEQARVVMGNVATMRADIYRIRGDLDRCFAVTQEALALLPAAGGMALELHATAQLDKARVYRLDGNVSQARELLAKSVIDPIIDSGNSFATLNSITNLAYLQTLQGQLQQARRTYGRVFDLVQQPELLPNLFGSAFCYIGLGDLLCEQNDLAAAEQYLVDGVALVGGAMIVEADVVVWGHAALARLYQAQGDATAANATLAAFTEISRRRPMASRVLQQAKAVQAKLWLAQNNLAEAVQWADTLALNDEELRLFRYEHEALVLLRVRLAQARTSSDHHALPAADQLLAQLQAAAERNNRWQSVLEILILQALLRQLIGDVDGALSKLEQAFIIAEGEGYARLFLDEGEPMAYLLRTALSRGIFLAYTTRLLSAFTVLSTENDPPLWLERLSDRELEVLRLVADGASNREIADELFLAVTTVKKHISNIMSKLNASSRTQAVAEARTLGLL
ncbi:MAG: AAA family ATPase [Anaerolineaceae bacterium]|nr:AAA family ATPase [Anaerolineaceae bacterium]